MAPNKKSVVGFEDEAALVRTAARSLKAHAILVKAGKYRAGELKIIGPAKPPRSVSVVANVKENTDSLFRVLLLSHELREAGAKRVELIAPWIAYGRQDRVVHPGEEPAGLMVGRLLSAMFDRIITLDAHSQAFMDSYKGKLVDVIPWQTIKAKNIDLVAAPDHGAAWRASYAADALGVPFVVIEKKREGKIVKSKLPLGTKAKGARVLLVDDIADSGGTLKAAARELKKAGASQITALVTHAFGLSRLQRHLRPEIISIRAVFDHAAGKLEPEAFGMLVKAVR